MSDLTGFEKLRFEKLFGMASGYVLNFSDRTFQIFIMDSVGRDIYDERFNAASGSKAHRLRAFWKLEPNHIVGKLLSDLLQYIEEERLQLVDAELGGACRRTVERVLQAAPVPELDAITPNSAEKDFALLAKAVKESIEQNQPEAGLDRLHTFVVKYMRVVCEKHGIRADREKPLHSLVGEYVKTLRAAGHIESEMTERILKSSISTLEAFNHVRNERSMAHDNAVLNFDESLLIFNHVAGVIKFIEAVERRLDARPAAESAEAGFDEVPF